MFSPDVRKRLTLFAAGVAGASVIGVPTAIGLIVDHHENVQRHERYAVSLAEHGSELCRLGAERTAGDYLNARVTQLQQAAEVQAPASRREHGNDLFVCKDGRVMRIVGDDSFETETFRAG